MFDKNNVLVIAAHPDDEVLGAGGTVPLIVENGGQVTVLIVTDGSSTQYEGDADIAGRKALSTEKANALLGTREVIQWSFPDMRLDTVAHVDLNRAFEKLLNAGQYDTVFVHHHGDINLDHRLIHQSLLVAARPQPGQCVRSIYSYPVNSSTEWGERRPEITFVPNFYVDISATIEKKLAAMACYDAELREFPHPRSIKALRDRAAVYGSEVGCEYAEAFRLVLAIR